jgi:RHS repeat-associated protein
VTVALPPAKRVLATLLAAVLLATFNDVPANAAEPKLFEPSAPKDVESVAVKAVKPVPLPAAAPMPDGSKKPAPVWPPATRAEVDVPGPIAGARGAAPAAKRVGGTPVSVRRPSGERDAPGRVRVDVFDRAATEKAGVRGVLMRLGRTDLVAKAGPVEVTVDYKPFRTAYGADWASRLRLVAIPECALAAPAGPGCASVPIASTNDVAAGTVTAKVAVTAAGSLMALQAAPSGSTGDFAATSLKPSATWSAGGNTGDFTWAYPLRVPPAVGGPAPQLALGYSAQSVDGRHAATNNQPSWVGEGFESWPGYVERRYEYCADDMGNGANNTQKSGDQCWATDNAVLSLPGHSGELIQAAPGRWHLRSDDGTRIERKTGADNGDNEGEYWVVTTPDGVQYWFGYNKLPGAGSQRTDSAWTVPVYGNHANEPCHATAFADSSCTQVYRWNLDYVIDLRGNTASYWYAKETNKYGRNRSSSDLATYDRGGYVRHIAYGTRQVNGVDSVFTADAPARVVYDPADRCLSSCGNHGANWPDVPWDQECTSAPCEVYSPTFWSTQRLSTVTTQVRGPSGYRDVERWTLTHTFPDPGDTTRPGLFLHKISHQGLVGTAVSMPDIEFTGIQLANRVTIAQHSPAMNWWRLARIRNETGGTINITYSSPDCVPGSRMPAALHANTLRCYPVRWTPEGYTNPITDYFHKYVVKTIFEIDHTGGAEPNGSPRIIHTYDYLGDPAWHYSDDDGLIEPKDKTWSVWRGYERVGVTTGDPGAETYTETKYFRGMHGDRLPDNATRTVTVPGTGVPTVNDEDAYAGMAREVITYNGPDGPEIGRQVNEPWQSAPTATRTINGDRVDARFVDTAASHDREVLDAGRDVRVSSTRKTFDAYGMAVVEEDLGDLAVTGDEECTKTTFEPRNTAAWLLNTTHRTQVFAVNCAAAGNPTTLTDADVVADQRLSFDGHAWGLAPDRGLITRSEKAKAWNSGNPEYVTLGRSEYDTQGRVVRAWDAMDKLTKTDYTPGTGGPLTQTVVTNPLDHAATVTLEPAWGLAVRTVDANGKITDQKYDGLGRLTGVWLPGRDSQTETAHESYSYLLRTDKPSVVTTSKLNARGEQVTVYTLYDSLLRMRQTQSPSPSGGRLMTETFYDSSGRKSREFGIYHNPDPPGTELYTASRVTDVPTQTRTVYDGVGRVTATIFQPKGIERWRTSTYYAGDRMDVTPPEGGTVTGTVTDAGGRTVERRQYRGTTPTGAYDSFTYGYNRKGQLVHATDAAGNRWEYEFDLLGRQTKAVDPDKGETTSTYDNADRVTSTTDSRGKKLAYQYDALGRKIAIFDNQPSATARARWSYDSVAKGQLSQSTRYINGAQYVVRVDGYSDQYQPTSQTVIIPSAEAGLNGTYTFLADYHDDGSQESMTYPVTNDLDTETLTYHYDENLGLSNRLTTIYGASEFSYVSDTDYSRLGQVSQFEFYTGLYSNEGSRVFQHFSYEPDTGRLTGVKTDRQLISPYTVMDIQYGYDDAGNVTKISDVAAAGGADNQCFRYDYLRQLSKAWTPTSGDCAADPTVAGLGGPAKYWLSWDYLPGGNRRTETDHAATGGTRTTSYNYPPAGSSQPHTVTGTSTTVGSTTTTATYGYDTAGNTTSRPRSGAGNQTLTWNSEGQLETSTDSTGTTTYIYDANGNRIIQRDPAGKTLYLPGQEIRSTVSGGNVVRTCTRFYMFQGRAIGSRSAAGLSWLTGDHQGTSMVAINANTQQAVVRRQTPFGAPRGAAVSWPNTKGFVGGTNDSSGLTHLGAREYDSALGRFVSLDPIMDLQDPQQVHGYAYARSNPLTFSDPSGLRPPEVDPGEWARQVAQKTRHHKDYTSRHNKVRDDAADHIRKMVKAAGGDPDDVEVDETIRGGRKGRLTVDIIWRDPKTKVIYVWEVKSGGQGDKAATISLNKYLPVLRKDNPGWRVRPGFALNVGPLGAVAYSPHPGELLRVYNGAVAGSILYDVIKLPPPPDPVLVEEPVRVPIPVTTPYPVPNAHRVGAPRPVPGPCPGTCPAPAPQGGAGGPAAGTLPSGAVGGAVAVGAAAGFCVAVTFGVCLAPIAAVAVTAGAVRLATS